MKSHIMTRLLLTLIALLPMAVVAYANEAEAELPAQKWSFEGVRGKWDKDEIYRGYTVATQVCLACHSFKYVSHRDLMRVGFTESEVTTLAKALNMKLDDKLMTGQDDATALETFGKVPPDLSLMTKAREGLANYVYALLTGYSEDPAVIAHALPGGLPAGTHFNKVFPGHAIAMPNPLTADDLVTYHDGTKATVGQMSHDVTTFMQWTAEPERIDRQNLGVFVLIYLAIFTVLAYLTKRAIWKDVKGH
jgi:ubiquinol-cytochrome c reductase cytochrome c1 subunit